MARLSISVLGPLHATLDGAVITAYDKVWALLLYLALHADSAHRRDALAGLLWPDQPDEVARTNLRQALTRLRQAIGDDEAATPCITVTRETIQFNRASDHWLDVAVFTDLVTAGERHRHRRAESCQPCLHQLRQALDLYRGDFLAQFFLSDAAPFEEWVLLQREALHRLATQALTRLANYAERCGDYEQAQRDTRRHLELDPWCEEAHRQLIRLLFLGGQRSAALAQYAACCRVLAEELGVEPTAETTSLYEYIRATARSAPLNTKHFVLPFVHPHNLPLQPTPFVGRERELVELAELLATPACRLLTLVGPGGIGKTRLALQAASEQIHAFAHGVHFISLASVQQVESIISALTDALKLTLSGREEPKIQLLNYLRAKEMLLVLDNFEHLLAGAGLLVEILHRAPGVVLLVTGRARLNLQDEWVFPVQGLQVPGPDQLEHIEYYSAVALFLQTARKVQTGFVLRPADRPPVVRICQLVQGMPLAVELAAAWVRVISCAEIAQEIEHGLAFLTTTLQDVPERHRSMRAVFDQSWKLLTQDEQGVLQAISVFRGGFRRAAAEVVAGATLPLLAALVDKSLIRHSANGRYEVHELIRQYACEKLAAAGDLACVQERHFRYFLIWVETAEPGLTGAQQPAWLEQLNDEHDNLRAALAWSLQAEDAELAMRLAGALYWFWHLRDYAREGYDWSVAALRPSGAAQRTWARAKALKGAGTLAWNLGDAATGHALLEESIAIWREVGDKGGLAHALLALGWVLRAQGSSAAAYASYAESIALFREIGDKWALAFALGCQSHIVIDQGDYTAAHVLSEESIALYRTLEDKWGLALGLKHLGRLAYAQGDYASAHALYLEALTLQRAVGHHWHIARTLAFLAEVTILLGQPQPAVRLLGAVEAAFTALGARMWPGERADFDRYVASARCQLDATAFAAAWAAGQRMTLAQAVDYARATAQT